MNTCRPEDTSVALSVISEVMKWDKMGGVSRGVVDGATA